MTLGKENYRDNPNLKRAGITISYSQAELQEFINCSKDPKYFINNYTKIVTLDSGLVPFKLWPFQERLIDTIHNNRFTIVKLPRQVGKTASTISYMLWVILFKDAQNILIAANKRQVAEDILEKLKIAYENIPVWLQQGVVEWNKGNIELENGSKIRATSTTSGAARSGTYNCIVLDEFAHIQARMANDFYQSVYPVISSGTESKIIIISTPKGMNLFYKFWMDAIGNKNKFVPFEVSWRDVPGRDDRWYEETISNIGEDRFAVEFECQFLGSSNTLISSIKLQQLRYEDPKSKRGPTNNCVDIYNEPIKETIDDETGEIRDIDHKYVITVDPAEGKHLDYSAFSVIDVTKIPYIQVAKYHSNIIAPILFPSIIYEMGRYFNDAMVLIEIQSVGLQIADILHFELEYEGIYRVSSGNKKSQQISGGHIKNAAPGVKTTAAVKKIGCSNLKTLVETDQLLIKDFDTIQELTTFVYNSKGTYAADTDQDNDDLAMSLVLFSWLSTQKHFKESMTHSLRKELQRAVLDYEDETMLPPPVIDDGMAPNLEKWGGIYWAEMNMNSSYTNPYGSFFKTWDPKRREGEGLKYDSL